MKILSIMPGHNSTVSIFKDGIFLGIFHEEKFNNQKNYTGFPYQSFEHVFYVDPDPVDYVVYPLETMLSSNAPSDISRYELMSRSRLRIVFDWLEYNIRLSSVQTTLRGFRNYILKRKVSPRSWATTYDYLKENYNITQDKVIPYDHHMCHLVTPVAFYGLKAINKKTLLFSMDGTGDGYFAKIYTYDSSNDKLVMVSENTFEASIGLMFSEITKFLGMEPLEHEYKVMGLAAYVTKTEYFSHIYDELRKIIYFDKESLKFKSKFNMNIAGSHFKKKLIGERFDNIAAAAQRVTEDLVVEWIRSAIAKTQIHDISCSGGVFMNVKMNQIIYNMPEVDTVHFQPSSSDESLGIGATWLLTNKLKESFFTVNSMFFGHKYSNDSITEFINKNNLSSRYKVAWFDDVEVKIADLLANNHIVARVKGSSEWGARSLCNRAILANASSLESFYEVNDMIKMRDFWMPFAPTIMQDFASKYIVDYDIIKNKLKDSLKYMIVTVDSTECAKKHLRAAIHQKDYTLRPQIVSYDDNPDLYRLLKSYYEKTGMGGFMNTSFNLHGNPLASTLEQGLHTFENSGLKYMALENWIISKPEKI